MSDRASVRTRSGAGLFALVAPILVVGAAYGLWWASDRILYVGPLDRAQLGWLVVVPTLLAAPVVAGLVWAELAERQAIGAAAAAAAVVGLAAAFLLWRSVADPGCATGNRFAPSDWIGPSLVVGVLFGASLGLSGLVAARLVRQGRRVAGAAAAIAVDVALLAVILVAWGAMFLAPMCERPVVTG